MLTRSGRGHVWYAARAEEMSEKHFHAWRLWAIKLPVDAEGWVELCVRAWDSSNNTEPTFVRSAWKCVPPPPFLPFILNQLLTHGVCVYSWDLHVTSSSHRIKIYSINTSRPETRKRLALMRQHGIESFEPLSRPLEFALEDEKDYLERVRKYPREPSS